VEPRLGPAAGRRGIGAPVLGRCGVRRVDECAVSMDEAASGTVRVEGVGTRVLRLVLGRLSEGVKSRLGTATLEETTSGAGATEAAMSGLDEPDKDGGGIGGRVASVGVESSSSHPVSREEGRGGCDVALRPVAGLGATVKTSFTTVGTVGMTAVIRADNGRLGALSGAAGTEGGSDRKGVMSDGRFDRTTWGLGATMLLLCDDKGRITAKGGVTMAAAVDTGTY
jgi:hypothetical protein